MVCGHTTLAVSAVLSAFMAGLALGAPLGGRAADRLGPGRLLSLYALLELLIGVCGLATLPVIAAAGRLLLHAGPEGLSPLVYFLTAFVILLPPTTLMGATLPVLTRWRSVRSGKGASADLPLSLLYGLNTVGAVSGCVLAGFVLLPAVGLTRTLLAAAAVNALCAALSWIASRAETAGKGGSLGEALRSAAVPWAPGALRPSRPGVLLLATGAAAMVCEVAWTRGFALVLGSTTYAFTVMLATFLLGLSAGSLAFHRLRGSFRPGLAGLSVLLTAAGAGVWAGLTFFQFLPYVLLRLIPFMGVSADLVYAVQFLLCALVMALPTFLMGSVFPWAAAAAGPTEESIGRDTGSLYAANTVGAILGSAAAGLLLLPLAGPENSLLIAVWIYGASALLAWVWSVERRRLRRGGAAALLVLLAAGTLLAPTWDRRLMASGMFIYGPYLTWIPDYKTFRETLADDRVVFHKSGSEATVSVLESLDRTYFLRINGKTDASESHDMPTQLYIGYIPMLLHPGRPRRVLDVGLGSGVTAKAFATDPGIDRIDVAEIEPAVAEAADRYFRRANRGVLEDPRLRLHFADGRRFIAASGPRYDIITSQPSNPWIAGIAQLFTEEAFESVRDRLNDDGVFCQWFHGYFMDDHDFRLILRTFTSVFPHTMLFSHGQVDYMLLGSKKPWDLDYRRIAKAFEDNDEMRWDLARMGKGIDHPLTFLTWTFVLSDEGLRSHSGKGPLHTDDRPTLEFTAPRHFHARKAPELLKKLIAAKTSTLPDGIRNAPPENIVDSLIYGLSAYAMLRSGDGELAEKGLRKALLLDPDSARAWTYLGVLLSKRGRKREALEAYRRAVRLDPKLPEARLRLGVWYAEAGKTELGRRHLEEALRLVPGDPRVSIELGLLYMVSGRSRDAARVARDALSLPIVEPDLRHKLLYILEKSGK